MSGKSILGAVVAGVVLFVFGFIYWAMNPLPYATWNEVADPAAAQAAAAELFPEDGLYFLPGPGNDPQALKLMETGPAVFLSIDHSPTAGADPVAMVTGLVHNILSALLLVFIIKGAPTLGERVGRAVVVGVLASFVILGSEVIWWQQPLSWVLHQTIYYLLYFAIGAAVLSRFVTDPD